MTALRVVAVDDEPLALRRLELLLQRIEDVELVGIARSGDEGLELISATRPDVVLLDVEMPGLSGFDVVDALGPPTVPLVVFVTAFDNFAARAFDVSAVDFVVKPVEIGRLGEALARARLSLAAANAESRVAELRLIVDALRQQAGLDTDGEIWVERRGELIPVRIADIDWVEAERDYVRLHLLGTSYLMRDTMSGLERRLDPQQFVRVRRSALVRRSRIVSIRKPGYGDVRIQLTSGAEMRVGRTYISQIRALIAMKL
jgi:DNA-binding LytR/AlgR family response regulator